MTWHQRCTIDIHIHVWLTMEKIASMKFIILHVSIDKVVCLYLIRIHASMNRSIVMRRTVLMSSGFPSAPTSRFIMFFVGCQQACFMYGKLCYESISGLCTTGKCCVYVGHIPGTALTTKCCVNGLTTLYCLVFVGNTLDVTGVFWKAQLYFILDHVI